MKLTWRWQDLKMRHRFATSQGGADEKKTLVVDLEHDGIHGFGEATPSMLYGQSPASTEEALDEIAGLLGTDPFAVVELIDRWIDHCDGQRAAIAAVENALHDLIGKKLALPVWRMLGLPEPRVKTTMTIGIDSLDVIRTKVQEAMAAGFDRLKVKVGGEHDEETLAIIRESFSGPLLLDANQGWNPTTAPQRIRALAKFKPTMIEQPLPKADWRELKPLRELGVAPIFADESCERPADVVKLIGYVDGVNIKFNKCGGVREALKMIAIARAAEMKIMLGCFVCSSLAIVPALTVARLVDYVDLDGALLLANDPYAELVKFDSGLLTLPERAGFGTNL
ncbi:MAG: dipeptide epimerase [Phycisphaerae bacterium]